MPVLPANVERSFGKGAAVATASFRYVESDVDLAQKLLGCRLAPLLYNQDTEADCDRDWAVRGSDRRRRDFPAYPP